MVIRCKDFHPAPPPPSFLKLSTQILEVLGNVISMKHTNLHDLASQICVRLSMKRHLRYFHDVECYMMNIKNLRKNYKVHHGKNPVIICWILQDLGHDFASHILCGTFEV